MSQKVQMGKNSKNKRKIGNINVVNPEVVGAKKVTNSIICQFPDCQCLLAEGVVPICDNKNS